MDILDRENGIRLVLASQSPRRKELISMLGIPFTVEPAKDSAENYPPEMSHREIPAFLASHKSQTFHRQLEQGEILVTADTLVFCEERILGKPKDREDAAEMLRLLSGRTHQVITGVVLRSLSGKPGYPDRSKSFSVCTDVTFRTLEESEISYYLDNFKPYDKAGAYAIQEWIGAAAIVSLNGSYNNVVGLPTEQLYEALRAW